MGNGMNKIIPGLYIGNFHDSRDEAQLKSNKITHVLSVHINAKPHKNDLIYLCISAHDSGTEDLSQYFEQCNDFIHSARIYGGNVLVHCLAGMSRSVTVAAAYIMTLMNLGWRDALSVIRVQRECANPNFGFQKQLLAFQHERLTEEHNRLMKKYPKNPRAAEDEAEIKHLLEIHKKWVIEGDQKNKNAENNTYPLPHNAYCHSSKTTPGDQTSGKVDQQETSSSGETQTAKTEDPSVCLNANSESQSVSSKDEQAVDEMFASSTRPKR